MIDPAVLIGEPLVFQNAIKIYPPRVKDVITNPKFNIFLKLLTISQEDIKEEIEKKLSNNEDIPTPFEYLILSAQYVKGFSGTLEEAFEFFCHTKVSFLYDEQKIAFNNESNGGFVYLSEENFLDFQNQVRNSVGEKKSQPPEKEDPNEDPRIRRIKEKARERDRIKAKQSQKDGISLSVCLVAICCMGIGITPLNIGEMSYASVGEIMKMMQDKEKYDIDIRSLLAGADSKKIKPKYWIRNND